MLAPAVGFRDRLKQSEVLHEHAHVIEAELIFCDECANFLFGLALAHRLPKLEDLLGKVLLLLKEFPSEGSGVGAAMPT